MYSLYLIFAFASPLLASYISANDIYQLTNEERDIARIGLLQRNPLLEQAAKNKAQAIFNKQLFSHNFEDTPFYKFADDVNYHYISLGENLAIDYFNSQTVVDGWMASSKHRANLLNKKFKEIGIAVAHGKMNGVETNVIVQLFGTPKDMLEFQQTNYYKDISKLTNKNITLAGFIIGTATIEAGTILSYVFIKLRRKKNNYF